MKAIFQVFFKFIATTFFSISAIASHVELEKSAYNGFPNSLSGRDFFEKRSPPVSNETLKQRHFKAHAQSEVILSCRDNIAKVVCLVNPTTKEQDPQLRECLPGSQSYAIYFERLYDNYPPALQKMFCSLKHIFVEKHFFGTAYSGTLKDQNGAMNGAMMGIRQSVLDQNLNLTTWASWKEQLSFGGVADSYTSSPDLPHIETSSKTSTNDFLYFVVAHEFGHIFDFANEINKKADCTEPINEEDGLPECDMAESSWSSISWVTDRKTKPSNDFPNRSSLCFYWCNGKPLHRTDVPQIYSDLAKTEFISIYSTTQPWDDFADSLAYFLMNQKLGTTYSLDTQQGGSYDIMSKLMSPLFAKKYKYLENFLKKSDIVYP